MKIKAIVGAVFSGIVISIKRVLSYNRAIKAIDREAYDRAIKEEFSLFEEMVSNPLFAKLMASAFWADLLYEEHKHKKPNSLFTRRERQIANFYLIWKEEYENKKH